MAKDFNINNLLKTGIDIKNIFYCFLLIEIIK